MKKTLLVHVSPLLVIAISFCASSIGMVGYLYYSDFVAQQDAKNEEISTKSTTPKDVTVYEVTNKDTPLGPMILPSQIQIIDDHSDQRNNILSFDDIFRALWIPLLIIGSYILVHSDKGIISKVKV